jgi:serine/threonine protein kinase
VPVMNNLSISNLNIVNRSPVGQGGFGITEVLEIADGNKVILKTINKQALANIPEATEIFVKETETLRALNHSQIPKFIGSGTIDGIPYILQEYIPGENLEQIFKRSGNFTLEEVKRMVLEVVEVLEYLHDRNIVHRDIKPQNILRHDEKFYLVDFGSSKQVSQKYIEQTGTIIGSFVYAAPEQMTGKAFTGSDIYSLAMTAIHLATGLNAQEIWDPVTDEWIWLEIFDLHHEDPEFRDILSSMLQRATGKRPKALEIKQKLTPPPVLSSTASAIPGVGKGWRYVGVWSSNRAYPKDICVYRTPSMLVKDGFYISLRTVHRGCPVTASFYWKKVYLPQQVRELFKTGYNEEQLRKIDREISNADFYAKQRPWLATAADSVRNLKQQKARLDKEFSFDSYGSLRGKYDPIAFYQVNDVVIHGDRSYIAIRPVPNVKLFERSNGLEPPNKAYWEVYYEPKMHQNLLRTSPLLFYKTYVILLFGLFLGLSGVASTHSQIVQSFVNQILRIR